MSTVAGVLAGKRVAVLVETEFIHEEIAAYQTRIPALGGEVHFLSHLWGQPSRRLVNDIDSPDRPVSSIHEFVVTECVTHSNPDDFDVVICAANYVAIRLREIPPMGSMASPSAVASAPAVQFYAQAMRNPTIVKGALCHALWILTPVPSLLRGRKVICHTVVLADVLNAGADYVTDRGTVVVDGDLVTGRSFADFDAYFEAMVDTVRRLGRARR